MLFYNSVNDMPDKNWRNILQDVFTVERRKKFDQLWAKYGWIVLALLAGLFVSVFVMPRLLE
jgi:hypothetical protein